MSEIWLPLTTLQLHITHGLQLPSFTALLHTHFHPPLHQLHSCHQSLINPDCLATPAPHSLTHMQLDAFAFLPHPTDITDIAPPPPRPFASVRFDPLAWSSGSDQRRISGCGIRWLLAGPDSLPLWLCRVCAFVLLRCFSCSHTVLPKEHSLGVIFFLLTFLM